MTTEFDQLRTFLKERFQFEDHDLDFGIYRIIRLKRKFIQAFIDGERACVPPPYGRWAACVLTWTRSTTGWRAFDRQQHKGYRSTMDSRIKEGLPCQA